MAGSFGLVFSGRDVPDGSRNGLFRSKTHFFARGAGGTSGSTFGKRRDIQLSLFYFKTYFYLKWNKLFCILRSGFMFGNFVGVGR